MFWFPPLYDDFKGFFDEYVFVFCNIYDANQFVFILRIEQVKIFVTMLHGTFQDLAIYQFEL